MVRVMFRTSGALMRAQWKPMAAKSALRNASKTARWSSSVVTPEWLRESDVKSGKVRVLDCDHPIAFQRAHIPHATSFAGFKATTLKDPRGGSGVISQSDFQQLVDIMAIDGDSTLVFYDDELGMGATRAWWVFLHYGYPKDKLKVLDGGWKQWMTDIKEVEDGPGVDYSSSHSSARPLSPTGQLLGLDDVQTALLTDSSQFVDARSHAEYIGAQANGNRRVGHVPGAVHLEWKEGVDFHHNGRFKSKSELEKQVQHLIKDPSKPLITYCQRGIRAAHSAFVLQEILGYKDVKIYEDSMAQYLNREDTAIEHLE
ncbi:hypothetical protein Poli38472_008787 [Pythium oligandrum]|uniref:Rhodanese domain-containing protein n=1 Tax=Pythium oligandrum TaxID=41045 RepID=A0A8K1C432_PYTOL|nr:hypothetical protein Poli38472_008787 [Pythium oligandrum]|eukprot:TMW56139.1 hypothetical protein Poli38472_008787 [Pythium oligandrum]